MRIRSFVHARRLLPLTATVGAACLVLASGAWSVGASATATQRWRVVERTNSALYTIVAPTATSAWVLGTKAGPNNTDLPFGQHWNGRRWSAVTFPAAVKSGIGCAGASSASYVWAFAGATVFGNFADYSAALRLSRGRATVAKSFTHPGLVSGCSVVGRGNIWVYGVTHVAPGLGTWRLNGATWSPAMTGNITPVTASTVSGTGPYAIAAGLDGLDNVVAHWNGHSWRPVSGLAATLPAESSTVLWGVTAINAVAPGNVWVAGSISNGTTVSSFVRHLVGGRWHKVARTNPGYYLPTAVRDGHGGWWSTGIPSPQPQETSPYLLHKVGGSWHRVALPHVAGTKTQIMEVVHLPGTRSMLAIAAVYNGKPALRSEVLALGSLPS